MFIADHLYLAVEEGLQGRSTPTSKQSQPINLPKKERKRRKKEEGGNLITEAIKYQHDAQYFDVADTEEKVYWLGFLMADGGIYNGKLWLNLGKKDISHLYKFRKAINSTHPIKHKDVSATYFIASVRLVRSLEKHGIVERKTFCTYLPETIPASLIRHFIRGYFDGDGSIKYNKKRNTKVFSIAGTKLLLNQIQETLIDTLGLPRNKLRFSNNSFTLSYGGNNQVAKIFEYLYTDCTVCLERKRDRFIRFQELVEANRGKIKWPKKRRRKSMQQEPEIKTVSFMAADKIFVPLGSNT